MSAERVARYGDPTMNNTASNGNTNDNSSDPHGREPYGMVPDSVILDMPSAVVHLYALLDLIQGGNGWAPKNATRLAEVFGCQPRTLMEYARQLEAAGRIAIVRDGRKAAIFRVIDNPARRPGKITSRRDLGSPPKAGSRSGHRGRRGENRSYPTEARSARVGASAETRVQRGSEARSTRVDSEAVTRVERAPVQVSEGLKRSGVERAPGSEIDDVRRRTRCKNCREEKWVRNDDPDGFCGECERF